MPVISAIILAMAMAAAAPGSDVFGFSADERGWHEAMECAAMRSHLEGKDRIVSPGYLDVFDKAGTAAEQIGQMLGKDRAETDKRIAGYSERHAARSERSLGGNAAFCIEKVVAAEKAGKG